MNLREIQEERELSFLSEYAAKSKFTKGRETKCEKCDIRTEFQRDRDKILHCKAFRRLKHKTQVFISPEGDHYRTRLTHTLEVAQIARTISRALGLNEDLTEAIALGHDLGHTPFGHSGENVLREICNKNFDHSEQSLRVVDKLENDGKGLNLTFEVRDGILNHRTSGSPITLEGDVVRLSDKIAYVNHDLEDAVRAELLIPSDIPKAITNLFGETKSQRLNTILNDVIKESGNKPEIKMSKEIDECFKSLRKFMFDNVYHDIRFNRELVKVRTVITGLYEYYFDNFDKLPHEYREMLLRGEKKEDIICDYIAGMTDRYAVTQYTNIFIPGSFDIY